MNVSGCIKSSIVILPPDSVVYTFEAKSASPFPKSFAALWIPSLTGSATWGAGAVVTAAPRSANGVAGMKAPPKTEPGLACAVPPPDLSCARFVSE